MRNATVPGNREWSVLRRFVAVVGPPDVEPDDLVQEAFVRALHRGLDGVDDLTELYLRRAVLNLSSTSLVRSWVRRRAAIEFPAVSGRVGCGDDHAAVLRCGVCVGDGG